MSLPYENATSGKGALDEMRKILVGFGASSFGSFEDFSAGKVVVQFEYRARRVSIEASFKGYAVAWLKAHPWTYRMKITGKQHEARAMKIAQVAVWSVLRDWIKGQVTAVECGILSFSGAFLGQILLGDGRSVLQAVEQTKMLAIEDQSP